MSKNKEMIKKYEQTVDTIKTAHDMIVNCKNALLELGMSQNTMDTFGFALECIKAGLNKLSIEKLEKEREWDDYISQFKVITVEDLEEKSV